MFLIPIFNSTVNGRYKANIGFSTSYPLFFLSVSYSPNLNFGSICYVTVHTSSAIGMLEIFRNPFPNTNDQNFALVPITFDLFNIINKFDSSNQVIFERRGLSRARNIECQIKSKHCENYFILSRKFNFFTLTLD